MDSDLNNSITNRESNLKEIENLLTDIPKYNKDTKLNSPNNCSNSSNLNKIIEDNVVSNKLDNSEEKSKKNEDIVNRDRTYYYKINFQKKYTIRVSCKKQLPDNLNLFTNQYCDNGQALDLIQKYEDIKFMKMKIKKDSEFEKFKQYYENEFLQKENIPIIDNEDISVFIIFNTDNNNLDFYYNKK